MTRSRSAALAAAVAGLFAFGSGHAFAAESGSTSEKARCDGVNSCKGMGSCKSAKHDCSGKNDCKGQSFTMLTPEECQAAKAKPKEEKK